MNEQFDEAQNLEGAMPFKVDEYHDILTLWVRWWNGPGREGYKNPVLPPLKRTGEALTCLGCKGIYESGKRCQCCGRDMSR